MNVFKEWWTDLKTQGLQQVLTLVVGGSGVTWYFVCLVAVGNNWVPDADPYTSFRAFMSLSITTIGAALATFVGLILGFQVVARGAGAAAPAAAKVSRVQWLVAFLYLASLLVALQMWWTAGDSIDQAVTNLGKSFLGLVGGALSVLLNMPAKS